MAELGPDPAIAADVARLLRRSSQQAGPTRATLIDKGLLYSLSHGLAAFAVPTSTNSCTDPCPNSTPPDQARLELFEYIHPQAIQTEPTRPNEIGMHRVAFSVDDLDAALEVAAAHGCHPLRGLATYQDAYKLTYVRGPSGILVMLAQDLKKG